MADMLVNPNTLPAKADMTVRADGACFPGRQSQRIPKITPG